MAVQFPGNNDDLTELLKESSEKYRLGVISELDFAKESLSIVWEMYQRSVKTHAEINAIGATNNLFMSFLQQKGLVKECFDYIEQEIEKSDVEIRRAGMKLVQ